MPSLNTLVRHRLQHLAGEDALLFVRFLRKLPALWRQERCIAQHGHLPWSDNRIVVPGEEKGDFYAIFSPDDLSRPEGQYLRTYNLFCHHASAWYMRREVRNFIHYAKGVSRFADVGSAEGFYSALFASMHRAKAEILSIDCGSLEGCNPDHSRLVLEQNAAVFLPRRWHYIKAFVTDSQRQPPAFPLPADCRIDTLPSLLEQASFDPELIKLDIESSEHGVLLDSLGWLALHKPVLIIEVHNALLAPRGLSFKPVLQQLQAIGYQVVDWDDPDYLKAGNCHVVLRHADH